MNNIYKGNIQKKEILTIAKFVRKNKYESFCCLTWEGLNTTVK